MSFLESSQKNMLFQKTNYSMFHYSVALKVLNASGVSCNNNESFINTIRSF